MFISIEGNIGAGKSTLLNALAARGYTVIQEPVDVWTDCNGQNLLDAFYKDPRRYAYMFQSVAYLSHVNALQSVRNEHVPRPIFAERSSISDYCFARNCFETGLLDEVEWAAYRYWWCRPMSIPDVAVYLRVDPETCLERTQKRKRPEEVGVGREYLEEIHRQHERWLVEGDGPYAIPKVIISDGNVEEIIRELHEHTSAKLCSCLNG